MTASVNQNPWNIKSLNDLQFFNCPSCEFKVKLEQDLVNHAFDHHFMESSYYLRNIQYYRSTDDNDIKNSSDSIEIVNTEDTPMVIVKTEVVEKNSEIDSDTMLHHQENPNLITEFHDIDIADSTVKCEIFEDSCDPLSEFHEVNFPDEKPRLNYNTNNIELDVSLKIQEYIVKKEERITAKPQVQSLTKSKTNLAKSNGLEKVQKSKKCQQPKLNSNMNKLESRVKTQTNNKKSKKSQKPAKSQVERTQKSRQSRKETEFMVCLFRNPTQTSRKCDVVQYRVDRMKKHYQTNHPELTEKQVADPKNYMPHLRIDYEFESHDLPTRKREFLTEESRHRFFENIINTGL